MKEKVYSIKGFDCPGCASNAERHLAEQDTIVSARIDFTNSRLYLTYAEEELDIPELLRLIAEVEEDEVTINEDIDEEEEGKFFDKETIFLLIRLGYCIVIFLLCGFFFRDLYWLRFSLYLSAYALISYDLFIEIGKTIIKRQNPIDEKLLMVLASGGAFVLACLEYAFQGSAVSIGNDVFIVEGHLEAVAVCALYQLGELIEKFASIRSIAAIKGAYRKKDVKANLVLPDGSIKAIEGSKIGIGDHLAIAPGEEIPVDGRIVSGEGNVDTSSVNGEFDPVYVKGGSEVYGGYLLVGGDLIIEATTDMKGSLNGRIADLVESSQKDKGIPERMISSFARIYTPLIFVISLLYILIAGLITQNWMDSVFVGLEIMVVSCPCALVISVPLAYFAIIGRASKDGIIIKSASHIDTLNKIDRFLFDKTGTLTDGKFSLLSVYGDERETKKALSYAESLSSHPLGKAVVLAFSDEVRIPHPDEFVEIPGQGTKAQFGELTYYAGGREYLLSLGYEVPEIGDEGKLIYVADSHRGYIGAASFIDAIRPGSLELAGKLDELGIKKSLLSGDVKSHVLPLGEKMGCEEVRFGLSPEEKLSYLQRHIDDGEKTVYLGDGSNDAPSLSLSSIGMVMGEAGTSLAVRSSDVILLRHTPLDSYKTMKLAKKGRNTAIFNIVFALFIKLLVLVLAIVFAGKMPMEIAVISDSGLLVLLILNSLRLLRARA